MNYELAKQLKEAGFPQYNKNRHGKCYYDNTICLDDEIWDTRDIDDYIRIPTLLELIEACGDGFSHLVRYYIINKLYWEASTPKVSIMGFSCTSRCKTPEEAVANLWLELNKK